MRLLGRACFLAALMAASSAWACSNPAGVAGQLFYNHTVNAAQFCDGTDWINLNTVSSTAPNTGCTSPVGVRGNVIFNATQKTHQVCNGSQWADMSCGSSVTAGSACANPAGVPGQIIRANVSGTEALWSCGGGSWARMGLPCAGGLASPNISQLFATTLYTGTGAIRSFTMGLDLSGAGGLVWFKQRGGATGHTLHDTVRGMTFGGSASLSTDMTAAQSSAFADLIRADSSGFSLGTNSFGSAYNSNGNGYVAWSFRRAPRFFDVVTWTGDGVDGRVVTHGFGSTVGMVIVKNLTASANWNVWHRNAPSNLSLNSTAAEASTDATWTGTVRSVSSTQMVLYAGGGGITAVNQNGHNYVAYIFAHDTAADGVVQCGNFTTDGSGNATVTLGWQPHWLLWKNASGTSAWLAFDTVRGWGAGNDAALRPDSSNAEFSTADYGTPTATGFSGGNLASSATYVYCAIRAP